MANRATETTSSATKATTPTVTARIAARAPTHDGAPLPMRKVRIGAAVIVRTSARKTGATMPARRFRPMPTTIVAASPIMMSTARGSTPADPCAAGEFELMGSPSGADHDQTTTKRRPPMAADSVAERGGLHPHPQRVKEGRQSRS